MKKQIFSIVGAILLMTLLCSGTMFSQTFQGLWADTQNDGYYLAISHNEEGDYKFTPFSFTETTSIKEEVLSVRDDLILIYNVYGFENLDTVSIKTKIQNMDIEDWTVYAEYSFVDESIIEVVYSGDYHATHNLVKLNFNQFFTK